MSHSIKTTTKDGTKIKVEGIPELPSASHAPSNKQVDKGLSAVHNDLEHQKPKLDSHGQNIVTSTQGLLGATQDLIAEKNQDERFQRLFLFTKGQAKGMPSEGLNQAAKNLMGRASGMGSKISNNATDIFSWIRETMLNLATSAEFRSLGLEVLDLMHTMLGRLKSSGEDKELSDKPHQRGLKNKSRTYDNEDEMNDEINEKLNVLLRHIASNPQYHGVVENFMKYSESVYDRLYKAGESHKSDKSDKPDRSDRPDKSDRSSTTRENEDLRKTVDEAWEILHDFAGRDSNVVPKLRKELRAILEKLRKDQELTTWGHEFKKLMLDLMKNPDNATKDNEIPRKMIDRGRSLSEKYRQDLERLYGHVRRVFQTIQDDPAVQQFRTQLTQLAKDMSLNSQGKPDLFVVQNSMSVIKDLLVERFRKALVDIPIKRLVIKNSSMDMILSNITSEGTGMAPDFLHVELSSLSDFHFSKSAEGHQRFRLRLRVDRITPTFRGVHFDVKKKSFPAIHDRGIADLAFEGGGLSADVAIEFVMVSNQISRARLTTCHATLDKVNLKIEESKHKILGTLFTPMIQTTIKTKLQTAMEMFIEERVHQIIRQLNDWFRTKPFETMMKKGNESLGTVHEKRKERRMRKGKPHKKVIGEVGKKDHKKDLKHVETHDKSKPMLPGESERESSSDMKREGRREKRSDLKRGSQGSSSSDSEYQTSSSGSSSSSLGHREMGGAGLMMHQGHHGDRHTKGLKQEIRGGHHQTSSSGSSSSSLGHRDMGGAGLMHQGHHDRDTRGLKQEIVGGHHDLKHVETHDKSKPMLPGQSERGLKSSGRERTGLKEGLSSSGSSSSSLGHRDMGGAGLMHQGHHDRDTKGLKQEIVGGHHDLKHVETHDKSKPMLPGDSESESSSHLKGQHSKTSSSLGQEDFPPLTPLVHDQDRSSLGHKGLKQEIQGHHDLNPVKTDDKSKPMLHGQQLGQQQAFQPST